MLEYFDGFDDAIYFVENCLANDLSHYEKYFDSKYEGINLVHFLDKNKDIKYKLSEMLVDMLKTERNKIERIYNELKGDTQ